jgi:hypothetical protein
MTSRACTRTAIATAVLCLALAAARAGADDNRPAPTLPTEASRWVGEPASWGSLRGSVTLVFVWTFG